MLLHVFCTEPTLNGDPKGRFAILLGHCHGIKGHVGYDLNYLVMASGITLRESALHPSSKTQQCICICLSNPRAGEQNR